jgi:hypothetical protein
MASHVERRKFLATVGATAAWPLAVSQPEMHALRYLAAAPHGQVQLSGV